MTHPRKRGNGEGSIYPVEGGYRGYVWVTSPDGIRRRKYVKGRTYEETKEAWLALHTRARSGPIASAVPTVAEYFAYWLVEVVEPNLAPKTYEKYEMFSRLYIVPGSERKGLTGFRSATSGPGSTGCGRSVSAAHRARTPLDPAMNDAAAPSAGAVTSGYLTGLSRTSATRSGQHSLTP